MTTMNFVLQGRDNLSRTLDRAGDSATRLQRRLSAAATNSSNSINRLARNTTSSMARMQRDTDAGAKALEGLKKSVISLAPAIIPAAAAMAPLVASTAAAGAAVGVYTAALGPQIAAIGKASDAEQKYRDAVEESGAHSQEAAAAQAAYARQMAKLPPATRQAAASMSVLKDTYKQWSDGLAKDTMAPFTKGLALTTAMLPKLTPLVKGTSAELDRMMNLVGGGMASPGFDRLMSKFTDFSTGTLAKVNDGIIRFLRNLDAGKVGGGLREFLDYARSQGPLVGDTLRNVGQALMNVLKAGSEVGVGMLQAINALSKLVAAVPVGVITALLQLAIAIKAVALASAGLAAAKGLMAAFGAQLVAMRTAAAATPGTLAAAGAAITALSRTAKVAIAGTGIGLLVIAISELAKAGKKAPIDVDKLTTSLAKLGQTGKLTGAAAALLGKDFEKLNSQLGKVINPSVAESINNWGADITGGLLKAGVATEEFDKSVDSIDKALANLVSGGKADLAKAALARMLASMSPEKAAKFKASIDGYDEALANMKFEAQFTADAMGLFGAQAQSVQAKLDAQKASTDGLRLSIIALNEVNRKALDGRAGMEAAIDAAAEATKKHGSALKMVNGELDLTSQEARDASGTLNDLARKTEENVTSARDSGKSWDYAKGQYDKGRAALIKAADAMGLNKDQARKLADQILKTPDKTAYVKGNLDDLQSKLTAAKDRLKKVPDSRKAQVRAEIRDLEAKIARAKGAIASVQGKTVTISVLTHKRTYDYGAVAAGTARSGLAEGGLVGFPGGGMVRGPGTGTSDSILTALSNGEYVVRAASVAKYGLPLLEAINKGRLGLASGGGMAGAGLSVGQGLAGGMAASAGGVQAAARRMAAAVVTGVRAELQISSPSKKTRALAQDVGKGFIAGLTGSRDKIRSVAADLAKDIKTAFSGKKESNLLKKVAAETKKLEALAKQRDALTKKLADAKRFAADTTANARQGAQLSNLGLEPEEVSAGSIKAGLAQKLAQIKQFSRHVDILAKRGLSKGLLRQILNMGPEQGSAYASALAGADKGTISSINSLQSQIDKSSTRLGRNGADALYDSGKNAGKGFLKGLESQQDAIEKKMIEIAKGMQKAIKQALGIKSPSTVMAQVGRFSAEGLARGLVAGGPQVGRAMGQLSGVVAAGIPAAPARAGRGTAPVVVHNTFNITGAVDPIGVGRQVRQHLLELKRTMGGGDLGIA